MTLLYLTRNFQQASSQKLNAYEILIRFASFRLRDCVLGESSGLIRNGIFMIRLIGEVPACYAFLCSFIFQ